MNVVDANSRDPPAFCSIGINVVPIQDQRMSVTRKVGTETGIRNFDSSSSFSASSEACFDPYFVTDHDPDGSSRVKRNVPVWRGLTNCPGNLSTKPRAHGGEVISDFDSEGSPLHSSSFSSTTFSCSSGTARDRNSEVKRDGPTSRESAKSQTSSGQSLLRQLREEGVFDSFDSDDIPFDFASTTTYSETDFSPGQVVRNNSEAATDGISSRTKGDIKGWKGARYLRRGSKKILAMLRTEGGTGSPNSEIMSPRRELAPNSKGSYTYQSEGTASRNSQQTAFQGDRPWTTKDHLKVQQPPEERKQSTNGTLKGIADIQRTVKKLGNPKSDEYRRKVVVNDLPIKDVDVKKAEECAGPIHPGRYWYDIQAGFWGVESGPCLGIIPPCILELNAPMSKFCAGGSTNIVVNGRELHEKDLQRLSFRGLPTTPGSSYVISIDGRVTDASTGKYVTCLGLLAPSLERRGRGAGIYIPCVD